MVPVFWFMFLGTPPAPSGRAAVTTCGPRAQLVAVIAPNNRMFWKVLATPRAVITSGRDRVMFLPSRVIRPSVGRISPVSMLKKVVLPAPFGPISETIDRAGMSNVTSLTATRPPNRLVIPWAIRIGGSSGAARVAGAAGTALAAWDR
jgi:hypothetical protein